MVMLSAVLWMVFTSQAIFSSDAYFFDGLSGLLCDFHRRNQFPECAAEQFRHVGIAGHLQQPLPLIDCRVYLPQCRILGRGIRNAIRKSQTDLPEGMNQTPILENKRERPFLTRSGVPAHTNANVDGLQPIQGLRLAFGKQHDVGEPIDRASKNDG